jgi:hypothetical protein
MAKKLSLVFGIVFLVVGILGFIPNPIVGGMSSIFHTDLAHNLVHLLSGIIFLVIALKCTDKAAVALKIFGVVYLLVAVLGFLAVDASGMGEILGLIHVNGADNWLHVVLGVVILAAGFLAKDSSAPAQQM